MASKTRLPRLLIGASQQIPDGVEEVLHVVELHHLDLHALSAEAGPHLAAVRVARQILVRDEGAAVDLGHAPRTGAEVALLGVVAYEERLLVSPRALGLDLGDHLVVRFSSSCIWRI